jgi:cAMP-dependent protein kinase regulator
MEKYTRPEGIDTSDSGEDDFYDENDVPELPNKIEQLSRPRQSVSAEVYGFYNPKTAFVPKKIAKSNEQRKMLKGLLQKIFMFKALEVEELEIVIDAMEERTFASGEDVICQGDDGDELYVNYQGTLDCFKIFPGRDFTHKEF